MNSEQLQSLSDQLFDIKEKCSDQEYKNLMDTLGKIYAAEQKPLQPLQQIDEEQQEDDNPELDAEITRQARINMERPLRGTKEWCLLSVASKAMYLGQTVEEFIQDEKRKLHWADAAFYQKYPEHLPYYLKAKPTVKAKPATPATPVQKAQVKVVHVVKQPVQPNENGCIIC